jgi:hypothetical protein
MKNLSFGRCILRGWFWIALVAALARPPGVGAAVEQTFDMLQIGARTYRNVTVTTKTKDYVFLLHSAGIINLKVKELSPELQVQLGYPDPLAKARSKDPVFLAKQTVAKLETPQVKNIEQEVANRWRSEMEARNIQLPPITRELIYSVLGALLALYLFHCFCCYQICKKVNQEPGILVWLPGLQIFPMLRAAGMSGWWFLAALVPILNLVAHILWCCKIVDARGKNRLLAVLLILPFTNIFAFLYLALSSGAPPPAPVRRERRVELMTLETA